MKIRKGKEFAQFKALEAALQDVARIALDDGTVTVFYDGEIDAFRFSSCGMAKTVSVRGDSAKAAVCDFVNRTIGNLVY